GEVLQTLVSAEACATGSPKLSTCRAVALVFHDLADAGLHRVMMVFSTRQSGFFRGTTGGVQRLKLRLADDLTLGIDPCQHIIAFVGTQIDQYTFRLFWIRDVIAGREADRSHLRNDAFQRRVALDSVLPYLISIGCQINVVILF